MSTTFIIERRRAVAVSPTEEYGELILTVDVLPLIADSDNQEIYPYLEVDSQEVRIRAFSIQMDDTRIARTGSFTLWDINDRSLITRDSLINFEYQDRDEATVKTRFTGAVVSGQQFSIDSDTFSFSVISGNADKLNLCPVRNLVMYDPERVPFDADEIEPIPDNEGNLYYTEAMPTEDLMLYDVLEEILVNRCGFAAYQTNLPDYPVRRADFEYGVPFIEGIKPLIGMFEAQFIELEGNQIEINDKTLIQSEDFPAPLELTEFGVESVSISGAETQAAYIELLFSESDAFDGFRTRGKVFTRDNGGSILAGTLITWEYQQVYRDYYSNYAPLLVPKTELAQEIKTTYNGLNLLSNRVREDTLLNNFDSFGRIISTVTTVSELVPDLENEGEFIWQESAEVQAGATEYAQHPYNLKRQYQKSITKRVSGLTAIDSDNPYSWNYGDNTKFVQRWRDAHRTGNLKTGMSYEANKAHQSFTESFAPDRNGLVSHRREGFDLVQNAEIYNSTDSRAGDVSVHGGQSRAVRMIVFEEDGGTVTAGRKVEIAVGELPAEHGIPLARRKFKRLKYKNKTISLSKIGLESVRMDIGRIFSATDREMNLEGVFLTTGMNETGEVDQTTGALKFDTSIEAIEV